MSDQVGSAHLWPELDQWQHLYGLLEAACNRVDKGGLLALVMVAGNGLSAYDFLSLGTSDCYCVSCVQDWVNVSMWKIEIALKIIPVRSGLV